MSRSAALPLLSLRLFGAPVISLEGEQPGGLTSVKARALLYYLAVTDQPHRRAALAELFWPDSARALGSLRTALAVLNKHLPGYVDADREHVTLNRARLWLDTAMFTDLQQMGDDPDDTFRRMQAAVALYQGEFLAGFHVDGAPEFEQWLHTTRYRFGQSMVATLMALAQASVERQDDTAALTALTHLLTLDPGHEAAHRQKMRIYGRTGQRAAAIHQFDRCRRYLIDELGIDPAPETEELYRLLLDGEHAPADSPPRAGTAEPGPPDEPDSVDIDLRDMPGRTTLVGRGDELTQLQSWLTAGECTLAVLWGMGGIGKTSLGAEVVHRLVASTDAPGSFQQIVWRSLRNAPPFDDLLDSLIYALVPEMPAMMPATTDDRLALLFSTLADRRSFLVLDNFETVMAHSTRHDDLRSGFEGYRRLLEHFVHGRHQSSLLITTRQLPAGLKRLETHNGHIRLLQLNGLPAEEGAVLLRRRNVSSRQESLHALVDHYSGNPLALDLVASVVNDYYGGNLDAYVRYGASVFDDIRSVLDEQFARVTELMRDLLVWLAIEREPVTLDELRNNLVVPPLPREFLEAVRSLTRSSLVQNVIPIDEPRVGEISHAPRITLQNVVMEYVSDRLLAAVQSELESGRPDFLHRYGLRKAGAAEFVQAAQHRIYLAPTAERLRQKFGAEEAQRRLERLVDTVDDRAELTSGYMPANVIHLKLALSPHLQGDFSGLTLREVDLRAATLVDVDLRNTDLSTARFAGNFGNIFCVAISPDGHFLAAASAQSVEVWNPATLQHVRTLRGLFSNIADMDFTPGGRRLAGASYDGLIGLWDVETGEHVLDLGSPVGHLNALAVSPDGRWLACGGYSGQIAVWDLEAGDWCASLATGTRIVGLEFAANGELVASVGFRCEVQIWDVEKQQLRHVLRRGGIEQVGRAAIAAGPSMIAASHGAEINVWHLQNHELVCVLRWKQEWVHGLALSADERWVASAHVDGSVTIWDLRTCERAEILAGHAGTVRGLAFTHDGRSLVSGGYDGTVRLWDPIQGIEQQRLRGSMHWTNFMRFSADGRRLACATLTGDVHLRQSDGVPHDRILRGHMSAVRVLAFDPHGRLLATGSDDCEVRVWDAVSGKLRFAFSDHTSFVRSVAFDCTGRYLAGGSHDTTVCVWSTETGRLLKTFTDVSATIPDALDFHPHARILAYGGLDGTVYLNEIESGDTVGRAEVAGQPNTLAFSPCGTYLACGAFDGVVIVWRVTLRGNQAELTEHVRWAVSSHCVWRLTFSPDGALLTWNGERTEIYTARIADPALQYRIDGNHLGECIAYGVDSVGGANLIFDDESREIMVNDAVTGVGRHRLAGHQAPVTAITVNPMTGLVASGDNAGLIKYWDPTSGEQVASYRLHSPYRGARIAGASGLAAGTRQALLALGAQE